MTKTINVLYYGSMCSGKSKELLKHTKKLKELGIKFKVFKPSIHKRDGEYLKSRALKYKKRCVLVDKASDILEHMKDKYITTAVIDEMQFFQAEDLRDTLNLLSKRNKAVIAGSLDKIHTGEEWKTFTEIKDKAHLKVHLKGECEYCGKPSEYTILESANKELSVQFEAQGVKYRPACKECFDRSK